MSNRKLIFEMSVKGRRAYSLPTCEIPGDDVATILGRDNVRENNPQLPEVSEVDVVRHYTGLSRLNYGVDSGFYPLGSCTMKYNPKINENMARLEGFENIHPYQNEEEVQGCLELMYKLDIMLSEITGMDSVSLQPAAGAHGEMTGLMIIKAYHQSKGDMKRTKIIVPDSAHGTNPASCSVVGLDVVEVKSDARGLVDIEALKAAVNEETAGLMLTNPNTLGLFEENICEIAKIIHDAGGLLYYDGANANAIMGITRPGDMGFDVVHLNLHKSFSTPHGGGGPGSGPVGVKKELAAFLPRPVIQHIEGKYSIDYNRPLSIGRIKSFYGNFSIAVRVYTYLLTIGAQGVREVSETAVLNANYMLSKLRAHFDIPFDRTCMHEFVMSGQRQKDIGVSTLDIAKRLLDYGYHPPTIYFPMIVKEAMMIEPTETESKETLDTFVAALISIDEEARQEPSKVTGAPYTTPVNRLDEAKAARSQILRWLGNQ